MCAVPPPAYGGTERVVHALAVTLHEHGHDVTLYASGDSDVPCRLIPTVPRALWRDGFRGDVRPAIQDTIEQVLGDADRYDVIHSHLERQSFEMARRSPTPVVTTMHGRLDVVDLPELLEGSADVALVAISENQRRWNREAGWIATIHHGLPLGHGPHAERPGAYLLVVGRATHEKGILEAIDLADRTGWPLKIAAKVHDLAEIEFLEQVMRPRLDPPRIEFVGEVGEAARDELYAGAAATLMLGSWPEPFGLVAIESLAAGTPVIGRRAGALPEIIRHGIDGFLVDDLTEAELGARRIPLLDRRAIRRRALRRYSAERMTLEYESVYRALMARSRLTLVEPVRASGRRTRDVDAMARLADPA
jgi:glycosyltransferase involved in cell wall biosynthesis